MLCCLPAHHVPPILYHNTGITLVHPCHAHPILLSGWSVAPSLFPRCFTWGHSRFLIIILHKHFYIALLLGGGQILGMLESHLSLMLALIYRFPDVYYFINPIICNGFFFFLCRNLLHIVFLNRWEPIIHCSPDAHTHTHTQCLCCFRECHESLSFSFHPP